MLSWHRVTLYAARGFFKVNNINNLYQIILQSDAHYHTHTHDCQTCVEEKCQTTALNDIQISHTERIINEFTINV